MIVGGLNFNSKCAPDGAYYGYNNGIGLYYNVLPMRINKGHEDFESDSQDIMKDHMEGLRMRIAVLITGYIIILNLGR